MNKAPEHIDDLIASYLAGEATPEEIAFIDTWRNTNETNGRYFEQLRVIFDKAKTATVTEYFDTDEAWRRLRQKLPAGKTVPMHREPFGNMFLKIAAGIILLAVAGIFGYRFFEGDSQSSVQVLSARGTEADTLPDGSGVFLNRETRIDYTFDKRNNTHVAKVSGEAYFNINHDDKKTFVVEAEGTFIRDIGTSFNVKAYPESRTIEVVVEEGEVMFYTKENAGVYLKANGKGIYNKDTGEFTVGDPEPNVTAYKTRFFSFSDHSLETVVATLNSVYSRQITIDDRLRKCRLTVSFNNEDIEEIAQIIAETLGLSVSTTGNVIQLKGSGCGQIQP